MSYFVYIVECCDTTYYVGSTKDVENRIKQHNYTRAGAKYTKTRRPVTLKYYEECLTIGDALRREAQIKRWPRKKKAALFSTT